MTSFSFDPASVGARRLARDCVPHLERWEMRVPKGHFFTEGDGNVLEAARTIEVGAPEGKQLVERSYELVSIRQVRRGD